MSDPDAESQDPSAQSCGSRGGGSQGGASRVAAQLPTQAPTTRAARRAGGRLRDARSLWQLPAGGWLARMQTLRARTLGLIASLSDADLQRAPCAALGPLLWDLGHMAQFEELWCVRALGGERAVPPADFSLAEIDHLYDAMRQPRAQREGLRLPDRPTSLEYLRRVRALTIAIHEHRPPGPERLVAADFVWRMMAGHESQHQETLLQGLSAIGRRWNSSPVDAAEPPGADVDVPPVDDLARARVPAGNYVVGAEDHGPYDNERPAFRLQLAGFEIDRYPVTNRRYVAFVEAGGYGDRSLWTAEGRAWLSAEGRELPLYWRREEAGWSVLRNGARRALELAEPVQHVCAHEAEAFARWCGGRLPSEFEWEVAAGFDPATGERRPAADPGDAGAAAGPPPIGRRPQLRSGFGLEDLHGSVYQWTGSTFEGYAGFRPFPYAQYSKVFFGRGYRVLRGSSWAAARELRRASYRNWDLPERRQLFCGLRLAWS